MTIRRAKTSDASRLNDLLYQVQAVHAALRPDIFPSGGKKYTDAQVAALILDDTRPIFVAADDTDTVLGYAMCVHHITPPSAALLGYDTLYLDDLCVDETKRHGGVGRALFAHVCETAKAMGCQSVTLNVWNGNDDAAQFYRDRGMTVQRTTMEVRFDSTDGNKI